MRRGTHCWRSRRRPCTCRRPRAAIGWGWRHGLSDTVRCTNGDRGVDQDGAPLEPAVRRTLDVSAPRSTNSERLEIEKRRWAGRGTHVGAGELGLVLSVAAVVRHDRCFSLAAVLTRRGGAHARLELASGSARELGQTTTQRRRKNKKTREGVCFAAICWLTRIELRVPEYDQLDGTAQYRRTYFPFRNCLSYDYLV